MPLAIYFNLLTILFFGGVWLGIVAFLRIRQEKNVIFLTFFTLFYVYLVKVLDYTLFQFQSLLLLKLFIPNLMLRGLTDVETVNLVPLLTLTPTDLKTSLLNILLFVPFGFGLPFITKFRFKRIVTIGALFSMAIELFQFITGVMAGTAFRVADINDVIFNTIGTGLGYILSIGLMSVFRKISRGTKKFSHPFLRHITDRPQT